MHISLKDKEDLRKLEEELWREDTRFDTQRMGQIFSADFFEYGRSGRVYDRVAILSMRKEPICAKLPLPNFSVRLLSVDVAQVTYDSAVTYDGITEYGHRSSLWTRTGEAWTLRFHQGTPFVIS
jgi:hypothetical protein